jgi:RNA polymerase sigma factor (sigma-70 family)
MSVPSPKPLHISDESRWFAEQVLPHEPDLRRYLQRQFPTVGSDVDDVVQESYFKLLRAKAAGQIACARAYLFTIARNSALRIFRRRHISSAVDVNDLAEFRLVQSEPNAAETANRTEEMALLVEAVDALPKRCREIVILRVFHGRSYGEIAASLGLAEQTVRVQMSRAVDKCSERLREKGVTAFERGMKSR